MAPLPSSLSPHICILSSPDLKELLTAASLPPLPEILQSFSPLPQVTTRTTTLTSVPHKAFSLRFSDLNEVEAACREDEEQRAARTVDWIGSRINSRSAQWVEEIDKLAGKQPARIPWWEELKRCLEGIHVPSKTETWNHPAAIILAVSTNTPNPLQAVSNLHSLAIELPAWVDPVYLRYTLILHPKGSALSDEEAGALFNAVKKQYGLHSYLLPLDMPDPAPAPVPVPTAKPRLPLAGDESSESDPSTRNGTALNTLRMNEKDIQSTAKFTREFLVMSLIPWMEKCVLDWNENFVSTRRLPSRLFSSTRRLFGTPSPSPSPSPSHRSTPSRSSTYNGPSAAVTATQTPVAGGPSPQRRLAEFATILGDFKLAVTVWETLSKEGKGGSDILPLLLSPSPAIPVHVTNALNGMISYSTTSLAQVQLRALMCAVRWEIGIDPSDFASELLGGERWLVWAAGSAEEPPSALLLAHAAFISAKKQSFRRAALWYLSAANRLEKCGIKPLTMHFLRKAYDLYQHKPTKDLSPSFWDAEGQQSSGTSGFDAIISGIEHPLGRLLYTTGQVKEAVNIFLGLLKGSALLPHESASAIDEVYLEDFRIAFEHLKATSSDLDQLDDLRLPFTLCIPRQTRLKFSSDDDDGQISEWEKREGEWSRFCKSRQMNYRIAADSKAYVNEPFWIDLTLRNPLDVDITLTHLTVKIHEFPEGDSSSSRSFIDVEVINNVTIGARETRIIPISIKASRPGSFTVTHATFNFLSLLPTTESLAVRGKRLHNTAEQLRTPVYAPETPLKVVISEAGSRLSANFSRDQQLLLNQGEITPLKLWLSNIGAEPIEEVWLVAGSENVWLNEKEEETPLSDPVPDMGAIPSNNSLKPQDPFRIPLGSSILAPGESVELSLTLHALDIGFREIHLLLLYKESKESYLKQIRKVQACQVQPSFRVASSAKPSARMDEMFLFELEIQNISHSSLEVSQISTISPTWVCNSLVNVESGSLFPLQSSRYAFGVNPWADASSCPETLDFVKNRLEDVVCGRATSLLNPPRLDLCCSHIFQTSQSNSLDAQLSKLIHSGKRHAATASILTSHPYIPPHTHPHIFPLFHPAALDVLVNWAIPTEKRRGSILISGLTLGASHSPLRDIVTEAENAKVARSMYAETQREKEEVLQAIRNSEWNMEMNPLHVTVTTVNDVRHDFSKGPCRARVVFTIRNYSTTLKSRLIFKLNAGISGSYPPSLQPAVYRGRIVYHAILEPTEYVSFSAAAWIGRPGSYALDTWQLETEVIETVDSVERIRHRYLHAPSIEESSFICVSHAHTTN